MMILTIMEFPLFDLRQHHMKKKNAIFSKVKENHEFTQCCPNPRWSPLFNHQDVKRQLCKKKMNMTSKTITNHE